MNEDAVGFLADNIESLSAQSIAAVSRMCLRCGKGRKCCRDVPGCLADYKRRKRAERGAKPRPSRRYVATKYDPDDEARIYEMIAAGKTDHEIAAALGRKTAGAISSFRFRKQVQISDEHRSAHIKQGLMEIGIGATESEKATISQFYPDQMSGDLLRQLPGRNENWIRNQARMQNVQSSDEKRSSIGKHAQTKINHDNRYELPASATLNDLPYMVQKIFRGGMLGDGGVYKKPDTPTQGRNGRLYQHRSRAPYYQETHGIDQTDYVYWLHSFMPMELVGNRKPRPSRYVDPMTGKTRLKCGFETRTHPLFAVFSTFYDTMPKAGSDSPETKDRHYKRIIPDWLIETFDEIDLLIWYLGDGSVGMGVSNSRPAPSISTPMFRGDCLRRLIDTANQRYGWHMKVLGTEGRNDFRVSIPIDDVHVLWPIWRKFALDHKLPECMHYKLPEYVAANYQGGIAWEYKIENGRKVLDPIKMKLFDDLLEMQDRHTSRPLIQMSQHLTAQGYPLSSRNIQRLFQRRANDTAISHCPSGPPIA